MQCSGASVLGWRCRKRAVVQTGLCLVVRDTRALIAVWRDLLTLGFIGSFDCNAHICALLRHERHKCAVRFAENAIHTNTQTHTHRQTRAGTHRPIGPVKPLQRGVVVRLGGSGGVNNRRHLSAHYTKPWRGMNVWHCTLTRHLRSFT